MRHAVSRILIAAVLGYGATVCAAIDAPHNQCNNISCSSCHDLSLPDSPLLAGSDINNFCTFNCHYDTSAPYTDTSAPIALTHQDQLCTDCHNPHLQGQKFWKNADGSDYFLARGQIDSYTYNSGPNTTTINYSDSTFKSGWTVANITDKSSSQRRPILLPNIKKLGWSFPITAMNDDTITVKGNLTPVYTYVSTPSDFAIIMGQFLNQYIDTNDDGTAETEIKFFDHDGDCSWSFAYDESTTGTDPSPNGICQACHTTTGHWKNDGSLADHFNTIMTCTHCHPHSNGFAYGYSADDPGCDDCHGHDDGFSGGTYSGTTQSHSSHMESDSNDMKGPNIGCDGCHDTDYFPYFADSQTTLATTTVCNNCHSSGGAFDGVAMAKADWNAGIYESDGTTLKAGKEQWCAGCHDATPAYSKGQYTEVIIDNTAAAFSITGTWSTTTNTQQYGTNYRYHAAGTGTNTATWTPNIPQAGEYSVYAWWITLTNRATNASYTINYDGGSETVTVNQKKMGGTWNYLGTYTFAAGSSGSVVLTDSANGVVVADAIKIESGVQATYAPNVIGDNTTYGFYVTGHKINCLYCHDAEKRHIDGEPRTYEVNETTLVATSYSDGYRLKGNAMVVPRPDSTGINVEDFALCLNCHNKDEVLGENHSQADKSHTNFWDSMPTMGASINNAHNYHLKFGNLRLDSDWDGEGDSRVTCICCHNVHGPPNGAMIRHGELISTPGTTDKVPALNFGYLVPPSGPPATATYTASSLQAGDYNVYAWWTENTPVYRTTDATYTIYHSSGSAEVVVDQTTNGPGGGKWNLLGTYSYNAASTGTVVLDNDYASSGTVVVADAVRWEKVGGGHEVIVDNPQAAFINDQSVWKTSTTDPQRYGTDCRYIETHSYLTADPDATLAESQGGFTNYGGAGNSKVCGDCHVSSHTRYIRTPNLWPKVIAVPGAVPATIPNDGTGSTTITVTISDPDDNVSGVTIDLTPLGGSSTQAMTDNLDGTYSYGITIPSGELDVPYTLLVTATDADTNVGKVRVSLSIVEPGSIYLDDLQAVFVGSWPSYSGSAQEYEEGFRYKPVGTGTATATWNPTIPSTGNYKVYAWWVDNTTTYRSTAVPYTMNYNGGSQTVTVDQTNVGPGGGKWNYLGTWNFIEGTTNTIIVSDNAPQSPDPGGNAQVVADAIKIKIEN